MTDPPSAASKTVTGGSTTLVNLPAGLDLPESDIMQGIRQGRALSDLNLLTILYETSPDDWIQTIAGDDDHPANLGIVSVEDVFRSTAAEPSSPPRSGGEAGDPDDEPLDIITPVSDPADLQELGMAITKYLDAWTDSDARTVVLFDSVSNLLNRVERIYALQFLHTLRHQIVTMGGTGFFTVHPTLHEPETMSMLRELSDDVIEYVGAEQTVTADLLEDPLLDGLNGIRRVIMDQLVHEQSLAVRELATRMVEAGAADDRELLEVALVHTHLPKLTNQGLVEYHPTAETVELSVPVERVRPYLRLARERNGG